MHSANQRTCSLLLISIFTLLTIFYCLSPVRGCQRSTCGPPVSKCQLMDFCQCESKLNATCFKLCSLCLKDYYLDCCSCVEICPSQPDNDIDTDSQIEIIEESQPELFEVLTSEPDALGRWEAFHKTVPIAPKQPKLPANSSAMNSNQNSNKDTNYSKIKQQPSNEPSSTIKLDDTKPSNATETAQCSVAYFSACMEAFKCQEACKMIGASASRWFYGGCCECVGQYCLDYGFSDARCKECPEEPSNILF